MIDLCTTTRRDPHVVAREDAVVARTDPAAAVLAMLCQAMHSLNLGRPADDIICRHLKIALAADTAVAIALVPETAPSIIAVHPSDDTARRAAEGLLSRRLQSGQDDFRVEYIEGVGHVASMAIHATNPTGQGRILVFSRPTAFTAAHRLLLDKVRESLLALWPLAERSMRMHAAHDWAADSIETTRMTGRELQVLGLLAEGLLATSIASRLQLSPRTVHKHLGNIYRKLGVHDRLVAVSLARLQGLVDGYMSGPYPTSPVSPSRESRAESPVGISR